MQTNEPPPLHWFNNFVAATSHNGNVAENSPSTEYLSYAETKSKKHTKTGEECRNVMLSVYLVLDYTNIIAQCTPDKNREFRPIWAMFK